MDLENTKPSQPEIFHCIRAIYIFR